MFVVAQEVAIGEHPETTRLRLPVHRPRRSDGCPYGHVEIGCQADHLAAPAHPRTTVLERQERVDGTRLAP